MTLGCSRCWQAWQWSPAFGRDGRSTLAHLLASRRWPSSPACVFCTRQNSQRPCTAAILGSRGANNCHGWCFLVALPSRNRAGGFTRSACQRSLTRFCTRSRRTASPTIATRQSRTQRSSTLESTFTSSKVRQPSGDQRVAHKVKPEFQDRYEQLVTGRFAGLLNNFHYGSWRTIVGHLDHYRMRTFYFTASACDAICRLL